jgi:two-component system, NarL family, nitrate/nitrite response regulator NarL
MSDELDPVAARTRVMIVEDHAVLSQALATGLRLEGFEHVEVADPAHLDIGEVLDQARRFEPDVVLLDLFLGDNRLGIPMIPPLTDLGAVVLMLTASRDPALLARCIEAGAGGLFDKSQPFDHLVNLLSDSAQGHTILTPAGRDALLDALRDQERAAGQHLEPFRRLTAKEADVLAAILDGLTADEIAARQVVSITTVRSHLRGILSKLGVNSQLAAVALAHRAGWTPGGDG